MSLNRLCTLVESVLNGYGGVSYLCFKSESATELSAYCVVDVVNVCNREHFEVCADVPCAGVVTVRVKENHSAALSGSYVLSAGVLVLHGEKLAGGVVELIAYIFVFEDIVSVNACCTSLGLEIYGIVAHIALLQNYGGVAHCGNLQIYEEAEVFVIPVLLESAVDELEFKLLALCVRYLDVSHVADPVPCCYLNGFFTVSVGVVEYVPDSCKTASSFVGSTSCKVFDVVACARALSL